MYEKTAGTYSQAGATASCQKNMGGTADHTCDTGVPATPGKLYKIEVKTILSAPVDVDSVLSSPVLVNPISNKGNFAPVSLDITSMSGDVVGVWSLPSPKLASVEKFRVTLFEVSGGSATQRATTDVEPLGPLKKNTDARYEWDTNVPIVPGRTYRLVVVAVLVDGQEADTMREKVADAIVDIGPYRPTALDLMVQDGKIVAKWNLAATRLDSLSMFYVTVLARNPDTGAWEDAQQITVAKDDLISNPSVRTYQWPTGTPVVPGKTYRLIVTAVLIDGQTATSSPPLDKLIAAITNLGPYTPANLALSAPNSKVALAWTFPKDQLPSLSKFVVQLSAQSGVSWSVVAGPRDVLPSEFVVDSNTRSYLWLTDVTVVAGLKYRASVVAVLIDGQSAPANLPDTVVSPISSLTPFAPSALDISAPAAGGEKVTVAWSYPKDRLPSLVKFVVSVSSGGSTVAGPRDVLPDQLIDFSAVDNTNNRYLWQTSVTVITGASYTAAVQAVLVDGQTASASTAKVVKQATVVQPQPPAWVPNCDVDLNTNTGGTDDEDEDGGYLVLKWSVKKDFLNAYVASFRIRNLKLNGNVQAAWANKAVPLSDPNLKATPAIATAANDAVISFTYSTKVAVDGRKYQAEIETLFKTADAPKQCVTAERVEYKLGKAKPKSADIYKGGVNDQNRVMISWEVEVALADIDAVYQNFLVSFWQKGNTGGWEYYGGGSTWNQRVLTPAQLTKSVSGSNTKFVFNTGADSGAGKEYKLVVRAVLKDGRETGVSEDSNKF